MVSIMYVHPVRERICTAATRLLVINVYYGPGTWEQHTAAQRNHHTIVSPLVISLDQNCATGTGDFASHFCTQALVPTFRLRYCGGFFNRKILV